MACSFLGSGKSGRSIAEGGLFAARRLNPKPKVPMEEDQLRSVCPGQSLAPRANGTSAGHADTMGRCAISAFAHIPCAIGAVRIAPNGPAFSISAMAVGALLAALGRAANGLDATLASGGDDAPAEVVSGAGLACDALFAAVIEAAAGEDGTTPDDTGLVFESLFSIARSVLGAAATIGSRFGSAAAGQPDAATATVLAALVRLLAEALSVMLAGGQRAGVSILRGTLSRLVPVLAALHPARIHFPSVDTLPLWRQAVRLLVESRVDDYAQRVRLLETALGDAAHASPSTAAHWAPVVRAAVLACRHALQPGRGHRVDLQRCLAGLRVLLVHGNCTDLLSLPVAVSESSVESLDALSAELSLPEDASFARATLGFYLRAAAVSGSVSAILQSNTANNSMQERKAKRPLSPRAEETEIISGAQTLDARESSGRPSAPGRKGVHPDALWSSTSPLPASISTLSELALAATSQWAMAPTGRVVPRHTAALATALVGAIFSSSGAQRILFSSLLRRVLLRCDVWGLVSSACTSADGGGLLEQLVLAAHASRLAETRPGPHAAGELFVRERLSLLLGVERFSSLPLLVKPMVLAAAANVMREFGSQAAAARLLPLLVSLSMSADCAPGDWAEAAAASLKHCDAQGVSTVLAALKECPTLCVWPVVAALPYSPGYSPDVHGSALTAALDRAWAPGMHPAAEIHALRCAEVFLRSAPDTAPMEAVSGLVSAAVPFLEREGLAADNGRQYRPAGSFSFAVPRIGRTEACDSSRDVDSLLVRLRAAMAADPSLVSRVRALVP